MAETYDRGDEVRIQASFTQEDIAVDPTAISLVYRLPDGTSTTYTYTAAEVSRAEAGIYYKDISPTQAGIHRYRWTSTGNGSASQEGWFEVRTRRVP